jgi:hypothetical protein
MANGEAESRAYLPSPVLFYLGIYTQKLALASPTSGGSSVGIVNSWNQVTEFVCDEKISPH